MTAERDEWKTKAEALGGKAGASHGDPAKDKSEGGTITDGDEPKTEAEVNATYGHNDEDIADSEEF